MSGIPLRLVLSVLIALVAIITFLVAFLPTYLNGIKAIDTAVQDLRSSTATAVSNSINEFYLSTWNSVVQLQTTVDLNLLNISNYDEFQFYMAEKVHSNRGYLSQTQYINDQKLKFILHDNTLDSEHIFHQNYVYENSSYFGSNVGFVNHSNPAQWIPYVASLPWIRSPRFSPFPPGFLSTTDVFPVDLVPEGAPNVAWGSLQWRYNSWGKNCIGLVADGSTFGRYSESVESSRLNAVLNDLTLRPRARVIVYDPDHIHDAVNEPLGTLIGARSPLEPFELTGYFIFTSPIWDKVNARYLHNTSDPLLSEVVAAIGKPTLLGTAGSSSSSLSSFTVDTDIYGATYVDVIEVNQTGLRLRVLLAMPLIDFLDEVYQARTVAIVSSVVCLLFVVVLSFLLGHLITLPLVDLGDRMALTATFNDDDDDDDEEEEDKRDQDGIIRSNSKKSSTRTSLLSEVASLQVSYFKMRDNLMKAKSYLPESLIRSAQGLTDDDEDDNEGELNHQNSSVGFGAESYVTGVSGINSNSRSGRASDQMTAKSSRSTSHASSYHKGGNRGGDSMSRKSALLAGAAAGAGGLNTNASLQQKRISMAVFDLVDFRSIVAKKGVAGTLTIQATTLSIVHKHVKENKGIIDYFQGDHIVASFNAATNVAMHARRAASCITAACGEVSAHRGIGTRLTAGMSSGAALVGNMGSSEQKRFCVVGDVFHEATRLERLARHYNVPHLVVSSNLTELETLFRCCAIDVGLVNPISTKAAPTSLEEDFDDKDNTSTAAHKSPKLQVLLYLAQKDQTAMDEWMYELEEAKKRDPFHRITQAFYALCHGDLITARDYLMEIHEEEQHNAGTQGEQQHLKNSTREKSGGAPPPRSSVDFASAAAMPSHVTVESLQKAALVRLEECLTAVAQSTDEEGQTSSSSSSAEAIRGLLIKRSRKNFS